MAKIDVVFNESTNETGATQQEVEGQAKGKSNQSKTASFMIGQAVVQVGKRALEYGVQQYGNLTGNYLKQNKIDNAITIAGYAGQIATGFATGGWIGGLVSIISVSGQIGIGAVNFETDRAKANAEANYLMQQRGGLLNANSR